MAIRNRRAKYTFVAGTNACSVFKNIITKNGYVPHCCCCGYATSGG